MKPITKADYSAKTNHPEHDFNWAKNPSVQKLLDVVIHILANEYIRAVKENPTLFEGKNGTVPITSKQHSGTVPIFPYKGGSK